ncbi:hypothetical protein L6452_08755 [Arctium lappa]|uniref:Uncharacterized protein n=1 Tax=Arctium lappa TaxID=4217 RepID=A0ACB9DIG2_ARCLA|nr:hypothetical protein L6452_08755 [Arctium lappa]
MYKRPSDGQRRAIDDDKKDKAKWCDFHNDHGHTTEDCITLKKELAWHVSKGNLKGIIDEPVVPINDVRPPSPVHEKVMNCITDGSNVCGLTYSTSKRHANQGLDDQPIPQSSRPKVELELEVMKITFDQDDMGDLHQKHHDGLIIQLTIGNCLTRRVLVDGGNSTNIIFLDTIKTMGIDKSEITRRSMTLDQDAPDTIDDYRLEEVILDQSKPDQVIFTHEDMVDIDPDVISHKLNVDPSFKLIKQKRRKFAPERNKVINDEVDNLLKTRKIREVKYPDWLANVVVIQKKNDKWRVYIDFTDLNKACLKDLFPLPHIDALVDATAGHELLVMPFGLKNAGSRYHRLVNKMFKERLGNTVEVYIDGMLVKSRQAVDHMEHLRQPFDILRKYCMKLIPTKCSFGVSAGKFLGYMVTRRGIEANPDQIKAIVEIKSRRNFKEVQCLTGRVAALNRYSSMEKLLLSLVTSAKKLRHYFESHPITAVTNFPLKSVLRKPELTGRLAKWSIYFNSYDIDFKSRTTIKSQVLADFVADFSPELQKEVEDETYYVATVDDTP